MPDVTIAYKNSTITSLSSSGAVALSTAGKYLEDDLTITYTTPLPNLSSITIKPEACASSSIQITPETYICETDSSYPGTVISMSNQTYCNIGGYLNNNIKIELNKTYHCVGQLFIKWDDDDTEEYYYIDSDFTTGSSYTTFSLNFTWEGNSGATQTFGYMYLETSQGYKTRMRPSRSGSITKSGILLPGSFYRITQVDTEGYGTINLDFNSDPRFYGIYQSLAYRSTIASSAPYVSEWCNSLSNIRFQQFAGQPFSGNFVFNNVSSISSYAFGSVYINTTGGGTSYWNCSFPSCTTMADGAFYYNRGIKEVYFSQCSSIGNYGFCGCYYLTSISFPNCTTTGTSAFYNCTMLTIASFSNCITIGAGTFQNCYSLSNISFPKCTSIGGYAFNSCRTLTVASFPSCTFIEKSVFQNCSALTTASFPNCTFISGYAFYSCSNLISISFPLCTTISGGGTFSNCTALQKAYFPECTLISGQYAFGNCTSLSIISFPKVSSISAYTFGNCKSLESAYFMGSSIPLIGTGLFNSTPIASSSYLGYFGSIYVPSSLLASYKTATNWATYSARMVGI